MSQRVEPTSKVQLIGFIQSEHQNLEDTLSQLHEAQLIRPNIEGEWSIKDILAHITVWEKRMIKWVSETVQGEIPEMPAPGMTWDDLDKLNQQTYLANCDKPLAKTIEEFKQSFPEVMKVVESLSEEDLFEAERFGWREGNPLWKMIAANTYWHYKMHNQSIIDEMKLHKD